MAVSDRPVLVVLRALGLGDLLTAVPALRALADAFAGHHRVLAAPLALAPLAELTGAVDDVIDTAPLAPLAPALHEADVAVNLHGRGPESHRVLLAARPRRLLAFAHRDVPETAGMPEWRADEHEVERWCRLLTEGGVPADPSRLEIEPPSHPLAPTASGATLIHPGAASEARRWPADRYAAVARAELAAGRRVVVTGGPGERTVADEVASLAGIDPSDVFAERTDLRAVAALVGAAGRVVCGDTGVAHLATAVGTPSVVLFGPSSPAQWGPPRAHARHRVLWAGASGDPHASEPHRGLLAISVADVLAELAALDARKEAA